MAEQEVLGDARGLCDFTRRRAAVILAGEKVAGGVEEESARGAAGSTLGRDLILGRTSRGRSHRWAPGWLTIFKEVPTILTWKVAGI
jgi:hypothetical protein